MAVTPGVGSIWQYSIRMTRSGQRMQMSTLLSPPNSLAPTDYLSFCAAFLTWQLQPLSPLDRLNSACCTETHFDSHDIQAIYPVRLVNYSALIPGVLANGALAGNAPAPNSCATFERYTEDGTRAGRGSMHPPVGRRGDIDGDGTWNATIRGLLEDVALRWRQAFSSASGANDMLPVLWNRRAPLVIKRFIGHKTNPYLRTMRRRTVGLGI